MFWTLFPAGNELFITKYVEMDWGVIPIWFIVSIGSAFEHVHGLVHIFQFVILNNFCFYKLVCNKTTKWVIN